jgi:hypothetical protein
VTVWVAVTGCVPSIWPASDVSVVVSSNPSEVWLPDCLSTPSSGRSERAELRTLADDLLVSKDGKIGAEISENEWVCRGDSPMDE